MSATLKTEYKPHFLTRLPPLTNSGWEIFRYDDGSPAGCTWQFTTDHKVQTVQLIWNGTWKEVSEDKIVIDAIWKEHSMRKFFECIFFTPDQFVAKDEGKPVYLGRRIIS